MITSNKKDYHFVIVGTLENESKEVAFEFLKALMKKEEIKEVSELHIFGEKDKKQNLDGKSKRHHIKYNKKSLKI